MCTASHTGSKVGGGGGGGGAARLGSAGHKVTFAAEPLDSEVAGDEWGDDEEVWEVAGDEWEDDEDVMAMEQQLRELRERKV